MVRLTTWVAVVATAAVWLWSGVGWADEPEAQAMAIVRGVAAVLATWLLVATVLALAGRLLHVRWLGRLAPVGVRRLVAGAITGAVLLAPAGASAAGGTAPRGVEVPVLELVDEPPAPVTPTPAASALPPGPMLETPAGAEPDVHLVEPGDHLWSIAADELAERLGRRPSDAEVVPYWHRLIAENRRVVGNNPSLIRPGDRIDLPS